MLALRAWRTRNSFKVPAGGLEPRQFLARGNSRRLIGNYAREQALYTRPGAWSRGNPWLAEIPAAFRKLHPRTCFYPPQNDVLPIANHILPAAKQCLAFNENCGKESCGFNHGRNCRPHFRPACTGSEYNALLRLYSYFQVYSYNNCWTRDVRPTISDA